MKKILVTGGAGFIGSNFIHYLIKNSDYQIINYDLMTYAGVPYNLKSINNSRYDFIQGDIANDYNLNQIKEWDKIFVVINFAAETHVDQSYHFADKFIHSNIMGVQKLLNKIRENPDIFFIQISTDEVYGPLQEANAVTEDGALNPTSVYAASKAGADLIVRNFGKIHGLNTAILRLNNNYGPRQYPEKLIPLVISRALGNREIPVYGNGLQMRNWLYVDDCCEAIFRIMEDKSARGIYNIGGGERIDNLSLIRKILHILGKNNELIKHVKDRPNHDFCYAINSRKIYDQYGWRAKTDLTTGLHKTVDWYLKEDYWKTIVESNNYKTFERIHYAKS